MAIRSSLSPEAGDVASSRHWTAGERLTLRQLLRLLNRRKWFLAGPIFVAVVVSAAVLSQIVPEYGATAFVVVEAGQPKQGPLGPPGSLAESSSRVVTEADFLQSASLLGQVVDRLDLAQDGEFGRAPPGIVDRGWAWLRAHVWEARGPQATSNANENVDGAGPKAKALASLTDAVSITTRPPSTLIGVTVQSRDKAKAVRIADTITELYLKDRALAQSAADEHALDLLEGHLSNSKKAFEAAERALNDLGARSGVVVGDGKTTAAQTLSELNTQLNQARMQRADRESRLKAVQRAQASPESRAGVTEILANPVISALQLQEADIARRVTDLSHRYGDNYPRLPEARADLAQIQGRIASEIAKIVTSMQGDVDAARAKEAELKAQVDEFERKVEEERRIDQESRQLKQDVEMKRLAYQDLLKRENNLHERMEGGQSELRAMPASAISDKPIYPRYGRVLYSAAIIGLLAGIAWIVVLERLDSGFRSTEQVEGMMGVPLLGMIPLLKVAEGRSSPIKMVVEKPLSVYSEALRLTHTAVTVLAPDHKAKVIMVTSSVPGEGKSTFACSLATLVARSNPRKRVLLIDCDLRRSAVAGLLGITKLEGTIDQYLSGAVSLDKVFGRVEDSGLYYIPAHSNTPNSAELLASADMQTFIGALAEQFDTIVLDTPPLMAVSDPRLIAKLADYIVFLVRWERTEREVALTALKQLTEVSTNIGVVLSQVDLRRHAKYGFNDYAASYSKYRNYYVS